MCGRGFDTSNATISGKPARYDDMSYCSIDLQSDYQPSCLWTEIVYALVLLPDNPDNPLKKLPFYPDYPDLSGLEKQKNSIKFSSISEFQLNWLIFHLLIKVCHYFWVWGFVFSCITHNLFFLYERVLKGKKIRHFNPFIIVMTIESIYQSIYLSIYLSM